MAGFSLNNMSEDPQDLVAAERAANRLAFATNVGAASGQADTPDTSIQRFLLYAANLTNGPAIRAQFFSLDYQRQILEREVTMLEEVLMHLETKNFGVIR